MICPALSTAICAGPVAKTHWCPYPLTSRPMVARLWSSLHEAPFASAIRHDPALRIGEVALRRCLRPGLFGIGHLGRTPSELLATLLFFRQPILQFRRGGLLCGLGTLPRFLLQRGFGFRDLLQTT